MPVVFVVPVRSFHLAKSRLAGVMRPEGRSALARRLATHVVSTLRDSSVDTAVATADGEVAEWARGVGVDVIEDPGEGLDAAAASGARWAAGEGLDWVIIHGDLPLLTPEDVNALVAGLDSERFVIAPSSDGGTSAIGGRQPIDFAYGPASFHRHLVRLDSPSIIVRTGLLLDVDSARDLRAAGLQPDRVEIGG